MGTDLSIYFDSEKAKGNELPDLGTVSGVWVDKVSDSSAAKEAGLERGDVLTMIDGKTISKMSELQEVLAQHRPGDKVSITWVRDKTERSKTVTLRNSQGSTKVLEQVDLDKLGVSDCSRGRSLSKR